MTLEGIDRPELWQAFFAGTDKGQYAAYIHCKRPDRCDEQLATGAMFDIVQVKTVPTTYCDDLVSAMVQLLKSAVLESTSARDKFVFLSETDLPVKSFEEVHEALTTTENSDFCFGPQATWPLVQGSKAKVGARMVKHSQWVVLSRAHSNTMINNWPQVKNKKTQKSWAVPVPGPTAKGRPVQFDGTVPADKICADEWATFGSIFGASFSGIPVQQPGVRSICRTFSFWQADLANDKAAVLVVDNLRQDWPHSMIACYGRRPFLGVVPKCLGSHPVSFQKLSDKGVAVLKQSSYLFARKFEPGVLTLSQMTNIILPVPM